MKPVEPADSCHSRGFSLVEILVALAIGTMIVLVVFSVYHAASSSILTVESGRKSTHEAVSAIDLMGRDLTCAIDLPFAGSVSFMLDPGMTAEQPVPSLSFHTVEVSTPDEESVVFKVFRINYTMKLADEETADSPRVLVREAQRIMEDGTLGSTENRILARDVSKFTVSVSDGRKWLEKWPVEGGGSMPVGARIGLACKIGHADRSLESSVIIPSGVRSTPPAPSASPRNAR